MTKQLSGKNQEPVVHKKEEVLPTGFEPVSPARKAGMIGRSTLWEHITVRSSQKTRLYLSICQGSKTYGPVFLSLIENQRLSLLYHLFIIVTAKVSKDQCKGENIRMNLETAGKVIRWEGRDEVVFLADIHKGHGTGSMNTSLRGI